MELVGLLIASMNQDAYRTQELEQMGLEDMAGCQRFISTGVEDYNGSTWTSYSFNYS
jgi:hypothetical protein